MKHRLLYVLLAVLLIVAGFLAYYKDLPLRDNDWKKYPPDTTPAWPYGEPVNKDQNTSVMRISNSAAGYEVSYPENWIVNNNTDSANYSDLSIKNEADATLSGGGFALKNDGSIIMVQVSYGNLPNGVNYANYATIDDITNDPVFGVPNKAERLAHTSTMTIGGKSLRVFMMANSTGMSYSFVYNHKVFNINMQSGGEAQYNIDSEVFSNFLASFRLI